MTIPIHPHLIILRSVVTVVLSAIIGQFGFAAAFLGGGGQVYYAIHSVLGWIVLGLCVAGLAVYLGLRRTAGPVLIVMAIILVIMAALQILLAQLGIKDFHIFNGILTAMMATALTSWTYRHPPPDDRVTHLSFHRLEHTQD